LSESNEAAALREAHANFFLKLALEAQPKITGPDQELWLNKLELEHDNFRAAIRVSLEGEAIERGLRHAAALWWFWYSHGHLTEGRRWLMEALSKIASSAFILPTSSFLEARAEALRCAGAMTRWQGHYEQAIEIIEESVAIWRKLGQKPGLARALNSLGAANYDHGNFERAKICDEESLLYYLETGNTLGIGIALTTLGDVAVAQRDYDKAIAIYQRSLAMKREAEDKLGIAFSLMGLGRAARYQGKYEDAIDYYQESLRTRQTIGDKLGIAECLEGLASSERGLGNNIKAAQLFGASEALRELIGAPLPLADRTEYNRNLAAMSTLLDEGVSIAAWAEGQAMSLEQAIEYALEHSRQGIGVGG
jgi:tetratricopeptide (TPR) repeat protein